jgi:hypothetical protein
MPASLTQSAIKKAMISSRAAPAVSYLRMPARKKAAQIQFRPGLVVNPAKNVRLSPRPAARPARAASITLVCVLEAFQDEKARCWAEVSGARLPIDLPAAVLRSNGIAKGMQFAWSFQEGRPVLDGRPERIVAPVSAQADWSIAEQEELDRLLQDAMESREQGQWAFLNDR